MVSRVLDATAFYAGIPFVSNDSFMTTSIVYEEVQHIKAKQGALEMLQQTNRLQIRDPNEKNINIDIGSDQTSLHNPWAGGYYPVGISYEDANRLMRVNPKKFKKEKAF